MSKHTKLNIGLFGFGVVGEGIFSVLKQTPSLNATIRKIAIKHLFKERNAPNELFTTDASEILFDPIINVVVELIDDAEAAYHIVSQALKQGKHVVSANKKMIAAHLPELIDLQKTHKVSLLYEAAVCGSIPVIRNLEEYYDNDLLHSFSGIVNGSTNYILTKMSQEKWCYDEALKQAQQLGFAESDPGLDVEGKDAVNKLAIVLKHAYGIDVHPTNILHQGITHLHEKDTQYAAEKGNTIKLVANAVCINKQEVIAFVLPTFVGASNKLSSVDNEYNGVLIGSKLADEQFLYGKGAGRYPTSSAVLSDIAALRYQYKYEYKKSSSLPEYTLSQQAVLRIYVSYSAQHQSLIDDLIRVEEQYKCEQRNYCIGTIYLKTLIHVPWFYKQGVSTVLVSIIPDLDSKDNMEIAELDYSVETIYN
ncbi:MAG: homoserine dehydrogenase [Bacteroidetes bacterium]|nr:homoserine dehydrogenase [Bacteroidota bacterium]